VLRILRVLWERGPSTVRDVHDALGGDREAGYTTVLKLMQIMHEKRLVTRDASARTHVFAAATPPETTQRQLVRDLTERAFGGSALGLMMQALSSERASADDLRQIRTLIDALERGGRAG
jgi:predicted transcriptional regulator